MKKETIVHTKTLLRVFLAGTLVSSLLPLPDLHADLTRSDDKLENRGVSAKQATTAENSSKDAMARLNAGLSNVGYQIPSSIETETSVTQGQNLPKSAIIVPEPKSELLVAERKTTSSSDGSSREILTGLAHGRDGKTDHFQATIDYSPVPSRISLDVSYESGQHVTANFEKRSTGLSPMDGSEANSSFYFGQITTLYPDGSTLNVSVKMTTDCQSEIETSSVFQDKNHQLIERMNTRTSSTPSGTNRETYDSVISGYRAISGKGNYESKIRTVITQNMGRTDVVAEESIHVSPSGQSQSQTTYSITPNHASLLPGTPPELGFIIEKLKEADQDKTTTSETIQDDGTVVRQVITTHPDGSYVNTTVTTKTNGTVTRTVTQASRLVQGERSVSAHTEITGQPGDPVVTMDTVYRLDAKGKVITPSSTRFARSLDDGTTITGETVTQLDGSYVSKTKTVRRDGTTIDSVYSAGVPDGSGAKIVSNHSVTTYPDGSRLTMKTTHSMDAAGKVASASTSVYTQNLADGTTITGETITQLDESYVNTTKTVRKDGTIIESVYTASAPETRSSIRTVSNRSVTTYPDGSKITMFTTHQHNFQWRVVSVSTSQFTQNLADGTTITGETVTQLDGSYVSKTKTVRRDGTKISSILRATALREGRRTLTIQQTEVSPNGLSTVTETIRIVDANGNPIPQPVEDSAVSKQ